MKTKVKVPSEINEHSVLSHMADFLLHLSVEIWIPLITNYFPTGLYFSEI